MYQFIEDGTVTSVQGFKAAGIFCGIKKKRKDLALIYSEIPCTTAGTFTLNKVKAAPLVITKELIESNKSIKAVLINSGNANACTGEQGYEDALASQKYCAEILGIFQDEVAIASTGVIGQRLPLETLLKGVESIQSSLCTCGGLNAAEAIMTTDKVSKSFALNVKLSEGEINIGAICKGSGMIMPNMATMLAFVTTDAKIDTKSLKNIFLESVDKTFNKITVDGETSTNDMCLIMANGLSNIDITKNGKDAQIFSEALTAICRAMAKSIVSDGEGATKLVTVNVTNANTKADADLIGKSIANSSLVKTAIAGEDANWGRILCAAGQSGADFDPSKVSISFDNVPILRPNFSNHLNEDLASSILAKNEFEINVDLGTGIENTTWWTCDFTEEYIRINADYRT